jgi:hypothetical protein
MNKEQKRLLGAAVSNLKGIVTDAIDEVRDHDGTTAADTKLSTTLSVVRDLSVMIESSFEQHVGAAELLRRVGARAKLLSSSKKG